MAFSGVYVLCATVVLTIAKVHTAPVSGLLSGLFGGDDGRPKQSPVDINQLLRQYYTQQNDDQLAQYNPYGQLGAPINYGQQAPVPAYNPYPSIDPLMQFQQPNYNQGYDPYSQLLPLYRAGLGNHPNAADDSVAADHYSKQLDALLPHNNDPLSYADASSYRNLGNPLSADSQSHHAAAAAVAQSVQSHAPVASSLIAQRVLADNSAASKAVSSSNAANDGSVKEQ